METEVKEFLINAKFKNQFEEKISKLNTKATKNGFPQYSYKFNQAIEKDNEIFIPTIIFGVHSIKIEGWQFAATLQHIENDVLIFSSSDISLPREFKESKCEHCNISRFRKQTYVLFNKDENKFIQVGSSCIKDFFNGKAPENIMKFTEYVSDIRSYITTINNIKTNSDIYFINKFLAYTSATIRDHGWVSKSKSDYETPTSNLVLNYLKTNELQLTGFDYEKASDVIAWISKLNEKDLENSYLHNLKVVYDFGFVEPKTAGIAASMIVAFENSRPKLKESNYVGTIGNKETFSLNFQKSFEFFSKFGAQYIHLFEDDDGNSFVWKTTKNLSLSKNQKCFVKGTIKNHSLYKEKYKQTELTRCKIDVKENNNDI